MSIGGLIREFRAVSPEMCQKALSDFLNGTTNGDDLRLYVKAGADVNGLFEGQTALIRAICADNVEAFEMILSDGPNLEVKAGEVPAGTVGVLVGDTAVIVACRLRQWGMVRSLVAKGANLDAVGRDGKKALQVACEAADGQLDPVLDFDTQSVFRLHYDPQKGDPEVRSAVSEVLKDLLIKTSDVADLKISARNGFDKESLVHFFSWHEFEELLLLSLSRGVDIDAVDECGWTALMCIAVRARPQYVQILLDNGAEANKRNDENNTTLCLAVPSGTRAASPHTREESFISSLRTVLETLVDRGADVNVRGCWGRTTLYKAVEWGIAEVVGLLVEKGADLRVRNADGETPRDAAIRLNWSAEMVALLVPPAAAD
mmetsp:Transcript_15982/g.32419  ORF Transcript_15982/g.32419 Transcript_15982/m.32419 type:complete len:374 (-) Transcript_15982:177-1298(-)